MSLSFKRKSILILPLILVPLTIYFLFYLFFVKDEYTTLLTSLPNLVSVERDSYGFNLTLDIDHFDKESCVISYNLYFGNQEILKLPCEKLGNEGFSSKGKYLVKVKFGNSKFYPEKFFGKNLKKQLTEWGIYKIEETKSENISQQLLEGIKDILKRHSFRVGLLCLVNSKTSHPTSWVCNSGEYFSNNYLKSIYLASVLAQKKNDVELKSLVDKEIEFLNLNAEKIFKQEFSFPEAYIIKLVEIGLDKRYLETIDNFSIPVTIEENQLNQVNYETVLSRGFSNSGRDYLNIVRYSDYVKIFSEYDYITLKNYYLNELINIYNRSNSGIIGLCSIGYATDNKEFASTVNEQLLKESIESSKGVGEYLVCMQYLKQIGSTNTKTWEKLKKIVSNSTITIEEKLYLVETNISNYDDKSGNINAYTTQFNLLDNLMNILYVENE